MTDKKPSLGRKAAKAIGWSAARRFAKLVPGLGTAVAIGLVGFDIKRKGVVNGLINSGLDAVPFVGTAKNAVELFRGDFLPDKNNGHKK